LSRVRDVCRTVAISPLTAPAAPSLVMHGVTRTSTYHVHVYRITHDSVRNGGDSLVLGHEKLSSAF